MTIAQRTKNLLSETLVWDNHACMPLRPGDETFLPQLERHRQAGADVVSVNVGFDAVAHIPVFSMIATLRHWLRRRSDKYVLAENVADLDAAKAAGKLAVVFDLEGGVPVEAHPGLIEVFYRLGVRWMLIAYNRNNKLGGGCQDADPGLSQYGRTIIDEMERVGMVLCCSHTGYRTAREALEYSSNPVLFSHSNARAICDHERNIPDDLIRLCAGTGGVVGVNGFGIFLGDHEASVDRIIQHIDYIADLAGAAHVGLGLDYVFDPQEMDDWMQNHPETYPADKGYGKGLQQTPPERIPDIADGLVKLGYKDKDVQGVLGHNFLRVAKRVWR